MSMSKFPASLGEWQKYSEVKSSLSRGIVTRASDPVLSEIDKLVEAYREPKYASMKLDILFNIYLLTAFWLKKANEPEKFEAREERRGAIKDLHARCVEKLEKRLAAVEGNTLQEKLTEQFGLHVKEGLKQADQKAADKGMPYLTEESDRRRFKLSFRNGLAYRWSYGSDDEKTMLILYDTIAFKDTGSRQYEDDVGLFVMGTNGRIYTGVDKTQYRGYVHSYFFAGDPVYTAGMIGVKDGQIKTISGSSGHYGPKAQHMVTVLERLRAYKVNLDKVKVRRINERVGDKEECKAIDFLRKRGWPTGNEPQSMWVPKN